VAAEKRILLVEDDDDLRTLFRVALTLDGFAVDEARTGLDALRAFESRRPDLLVLDLNLPGIDGYAVHQEISLESATHGVPIVIVTGEPGVSSKMNASCVLRKPVPPEELVRTVRKCLDMPSGIAGA
jgi:two-component system OmpR family response regulator